MILLIDNYDSFSFNLVQALRAVSSDEVIVRRNDKITIDEVMAMKPDGIVISPGPGHPENERDFGINYELIRKQELLDCPILGVCLGHQGIVYSLGGVVEQAPNIMHGKTSRIRIVERSKLFEDCAEELVAMRYHSLIALDRDLPGCLRVIARDAETDVIMAVEHKSQPIFGLQFHPESIGTPDGEKILRNFTNNIVARHRVTCTH